MKIFPDSIITRGWFEEFKSKEEEHRIGIEDELEDWFPIYMW